MSAIEPLAVVRAVHVASSIAVTGAIAFRLLVLPRSARRPRGADSAVENAERWTSAWCAAALGIAIASWLVWLVLTASSMSGLPLGQAVDANVLGSVLGTTFGRVWLGRSACMLVLVACLASTRRSSGRRGGVDAIGAWMALLLASTLSGAGHAVGGEGPERIAHVVTDALHALGAAAWVGALVPVLFVLGRASADGERGWDALASVATQRFSTLGVCAVVVLLGTGLLNAAWLVGSWDALGSTRYGQLVEAKATLFVVMLGIAAVNRLVWTPRLGALPDDRRAVRALRRNAAVEVALGATVIALVGVLGTTAPSAHEQMAAQHAAREHSLAATASEAAVLAADR